MKGNLKNCHESRCVSAVVLLHIHSAVVQLFSNFRCERPFGVQLIPHTNMVLIVADKMCPCFATKISIEPTKVEYGPTNETAYCDRLKYNIYRKKPTMW